ncbi:MAG: 2-oxoacid:acceptor oxidoreductase family protein [Planctomycetota bacterium]
MEMRTIFAGFGGQGIVFMGTLLAHAGMEHGQHVTFYPSYGPAMRGGTANCSVIVSTDVIASPIIATANALVVMNEPSLDFFSDRLEPRGTLLVNSSLIKKKIERADITVHYLPANHIAEQLGDGRMANMVMLGAMTRATNVLPIATLLTTLRHVLAKKRPQMIECNIKAMQHGYDALL